MSHHKTIIGTDGASDGPSGATLQERIPNMPTFDRMHCRVSDIKVAVTKDDAGRKRVTGVAINGRQMAPTDRFFTSLFAKYGIGNSTFKYFSHDEVFERISSVANSDKLVATVERHPNGTERLLAAAAPGTVQVNHNELLGLLNRYGVSLDGADYGGQGHRRPGNRPRIPISLLPPGIGNNNIMTSSSGDGGARTLADVPQLSYDCGVVRSIHTPTMARPLNIAGDVFGDRYVLDTPIDGYGKPAIYLMLLREICTNHAIGYSSVFRSDLSLGKKEDSFEFPLVRAFEGFNSEDGFAALHNRMELAARSWASIAETNRVYKTLVRIHHKGMIRGVSKKFQNDEVGTDGADMVEHSPLIKDFQRLIGGGKADGLIRKYGLANIDALTHKKQRALPCGAKVYELINFVSEIATHHATPEGARIMQAVVGDFMSADYDLERTVDVFPEWDAFLAMDSKAQLALATANAN